MRTFRVAPTFWGMASESARINGVWLGKHIGSITSRCLGTGACAPSRRRLKSGLGRAAKTEPRTTSSTPLARTSRNTTLHCRETCQNVERQSAKMLRFGGRGERGYGPNSWQFCSLSIYSHPCAFPAWFWKRPYAWGREYSIMFHTRTPYSFTYHCWQERWPFHVPSTEK